MKEFQHVLQTKLGLHAKPAGEFVQMVKSLDSAVTVEKGGQVVSADKLLALASLDVHKGDTITITFENDVSDEEVNRFKEFAEKHL